MLLEILGAGSFVQGIIFLLAGVALFRKINRKEWAVALVNYFFLLLTATATLGLMKSPFHLGGSRLPMGGLLGDFSGGFLRSYLNTSGAFLLTSFIFLFAVSISTRISVRDIGLYIWWGLSKASILLSGAVFYACLQIWDSVSQAYSHLRPHLAQGLRSIGQQISELWKKPAIKQVKIETATAPAVKKTEPRIEPAPSFTESPLAPVIPMRKLELVPAAAPEHNSAQPEIIYQKPESGSNLFDAPGEMEASAGQKSKSSGLMSFVKKAVKENERSVKEALGKKVHFQIPPLSFLNTPVTEESKHDREELLRNSKMLEEKLADFNVEGQVMAVKPGPVVTMYEFKPAAGVKVNTISNLSDDLALALSAKSIRIVAPIPGRDVVGIEVPNKHRESVLLKEIIGADTFQSKNHSIPIAIGKDILGLPVVADLKKMPHLLVAGTTGSGKSVFINSLICSLLYKFTPEEMNLILVDPKQLELAPYNDIPHLLLPVVTEPKKASLALNWAVQEMERRYRVIAASVTRDQEGFNKKLEEIGADKMADLINRGKEDLEKVSVEKMPKLVVVIDELADLMMTAKADVENNICRLAQKARAAGIHLVLATQRPSTDVITGLIKANLPSRICFKVSSKIDSRVMFDAMGAEKLIGNGDMLFMPPGDSSLVRMHGTYISVEEVDQITTFWKSQAKPNYRDDILIDPEEDMEGGAFPAADLNDPQYNQALDVAYSTGSISASYLQRRLSIGYNKAARYVEMMEAQGIVGPADGSKPRPVLNARP